MCISRTLFIGLLTLLATVCLYGQFESGTVLGTVHDPSGANIGNATVTLENTTTGVTLPGKTDGNGNYEFVNVRLGSYHVRVGSPGFQTTTTENFDLTVNARQRVDLTLQVGQTSEQVTVTDTVALLQTDSSSRGQLINPRQIVDLPLNGRSYADLTLLVPGVAKSPLENQTDNSRDASFNVNGQRSELNSFLLDGVDNNAYGTSNQGFSNQVIQPNPDALAEFKVETTNYSAEYGRATGAVINATIKSGTNQLHGELWEFLRNTDLNATGFFKPVNGAKPAFNQNQFGAALGGPIVKNKIFVFGDYEGFRRVFHPVQFATLPTALPRQGNFTIPIKNPYTGAVYSNGIIPTSAITPFAATVFSQLPSPNLPGTSNNYQSAPADTIYGDKGDIRYDQYIGEKLSIFGRYSQNDTRIFSPPAIPGPSGGNANGPVYIRNKQLVPGVTWTISPTSILEVRAGLDYTEAGKNPIGLGLPISQYNIPNLPDNPAFGGGLYSLNFSGGLSQLGRQSSNPQYQYPLVVDPKVNYTRILGRHSLKFGFEYQLIDTQVQDFHPKYGVDNYSGFFSSPVGTSGLSAAQQQAFSTADFLFGARSHYEINNYAVAHLRQRMYFGYLQDDFRASEKLTFNLGVRYEFATPQWERDNKLSNFDPSTGTLIFAKSGSLYDRALVHPATNNWAPRVGLAYRVAPKTVIRSAFGISYVQFNRLGGENLLAYNGPNVVDAIIDQVPGQGTGTCTSVDDAAGACFRPTALGFPNNFATPAAFNTANTQVRYIPANNPTGYVETWHFTVERELAHNLLLDLAYLGNHSVGLMILADANQAVPNLAGQNLSINARRPIPNFTTIEEAFGFGFGSYNALQFKVEKRYSGGLYFINSFTWSKAIDNAPGHLENYNGDNSRINIRAPQTERGISSYDQPFNNTTSVVWDIPVGNGRHFNLQNRAADLLIGGWSVNVINTATSGLPVNVTYSASTQASVSPLLSPRPNLTGSPIYTSGGNPTQFLNAAAFVVPNFTQPFGAAGRNIVRGPSLQQLDLALHKNFRLWSESSRVEFRAEAFNLFNKTLFNVNSGFGTSANSGGFGVFTQTLPPRQIQMALKLVF